MIPVDVVDRATARPLSLSTNVPNPQDSTKRASMNVGRSFLIERLVGDFGWRRNDIDLLLADLEAVGVEFVFKNDLHKLYFMYEFLFQALGANAEEIEEKGMDYYYERFRDKTISQEPA